MRQQPSPQVLAASRIDGRRSITRPMCACSRTCVIVCALAMSGSTAAGNAGLKATSCRGHLRSAQGGPVAAGDRTDPGISRRPRRCARSGLAAVGKLAGQEA
jgi:hypothetical protein